MKTDPLFYFKNREEWRAWLESNHDKYSKVWLIYYKKHTEKPRIPYDDAVEEALCFGWIDSTVKRIDDEKYAQKFTPRRNKSIWSPLNKKRVKKLIKNGQMREEGLEKINYAKKNGIWDRKYPDFEPPEECPELTAALDNDAAAKVNFQELSPSQKNLFIGWITYAKKEETKKKRIAEALSILRKGEKLGMK